MEKGQASGNVDAVVSVTFSKAAQNSPKAPKTAQSSILANAPAVRGLFSNLLTACRCRSVKLQPSSQQQIPSVRLSLVRFQEIKPPFLEPPLP